MSNNNNKNIHNKKYKTIDNKTNNTYKKNKYDKNYNEDKYVGAPYNFVPFVDEVYYYNADEKENRNLTKHNDISSDLYTGEIEYNITSMTPIIIDAGNGNFYENANKKYSIPGSTMRGLIRNNVQILGLSSIVDDIDDYSLMYRNIAYGADKKIYNEILGSIQNKDQKCNINILKNVRAGYIRNESGKYKIYPAKSIKDKNNKDLNYYVLSEKKVIEEYLDAQEKKCISKFQFFNDEYNKNLLEHEFERFERKEINGRVHYIGKKNNKFKPGYKYISYKTNNSNRICAVDKKDVYENKGFVMCTGKMNEKKAMYIIPEKNEKQKAIEINDIDVQNFKIDLNKREKSLKQFGGKGFFDLPEIGEEKPVFYISYKDRLYFGFTPHLRLFYKNDIKHGLNKSQKDNKIDYCKALFGYCNEKDGYKTRVSFCDAVIVNETNKLNLTSRILSEPKPTSYLDYLQQEKYNKFTFNNDNFTLRGVKQYWLHKNLVNDTENKNENIKSHFTPLDTGTQFKGKIRYKNLTKDELGLLLWSIKLKDNSWMNIGKAKAYGFGCIKINNIKVRRFIQEKAYNDLEKLCLSPYEELNIDKLIEYYKSFINDKIQKNIDELQHIQVFFLLKDSDKIPNEELIRYMNINNKEYQGRKKALPIADEVLNVNVYGKNKKNHNDNSNYTKNDREQNSNKTKGDKDVNKRKILNREDHLTTPLGDQIQSLNIERK